MAKIDKNTYAMKAKAARLEMVPEFFQVFEAKILRSVLSCPF